MRKPSQILDAGTEMKAEQKKWPFFFSEPVVVFANQNMNSKNKLWLAQIHGKQAVIKTDRMLPESYQKKNASMVLLMKLQC